MSQEFATELAVALQAVRFASRICQQVQSEIRADALEKKDKSPVTIADYASQAVVCRALREAFPDVPIVAEEDAAALRDPAQQDFLRQAVEQIQQAGQPATPGEVLSWIDAGNHDATAERYWTLDPIDGTKGFLRKEQFAVSLALLVNGTIQVAALACPNLPNPDGSTGVVFTAVRGEGARAHSLAPGSDQGSTIHVSRVDELSRARVCESVESSHSSHGESAQLLERLGIQAAPVRMDSQAKYGVLARGDAEIYLRLPTRADYVEKIWDHAGGVLVIEEAGGRVTDLHGHPLDFRQGSTLSANQGVVATNGKFHDQVLSALNA